jgi:hypothetical protein
MKIATHHEVLKDAKKWRTSNTAESRAKAIKILERGMTRFTDALSLGEELVLLHKENGQLDLAIQTLRKLECRFQQIGEETLCRWGSVLRLRGLRELAGNALGAALADVKEAEAYFARAFEEFGTHYPRINALTTRFIRAGLARQMEGETVSGNLVRSVKADARALLDDERIWTRLKPDDHVWAPASRGEACFLLEDWDCAEAAYAEAVQAAGAEAFPRQCMAKQIHDILLPAFERLGREVSPKLANPDQFFGIV